MVKRADEELAKKEFSLFLQNILNLHDYVWHDVSQKDEPPDFLLKLQEKLYSVEVTSIMEMIEMGGNTLSSLAVSVFIKNFVESIEKISLDMGVLNGVYVVTMSPFKDFSKQENELQNKLLSYIDSTKTFQHAQEEIIFDDGISFCSIQKLEGDKNLVAEVVDYPGKWEGESIVDLERLLREAISTKKRKLSKINGEKILLIIDSFNYLEEEHWKNIIEKIEEKSDFSIIFRASPSTRSSIIYENNWLK